MYRLRGKRGSAAALVLGAWLGCAAPGLAQLARIPAWEAAPGETGASAEARKRFAEDAEKLLAGASAVKAEWGILVVDARTGETLYARNAES